VLVAYLPYVADHINIYDHDPLPGYFHFVQKLRYFDARTVLRFSLCVGVSLCYIFSPLGYTVDTSLGCAYNLLGISI